MSHQPAAVSKIGAFRDQFPGKRICAEGRYCMDCEHFRIGDFPARMCSQFPEKHIYAPGLSYAGEKAENSSVQAEECLQFQWAEGVEAT